MSDVSGQEQNWDVSAAEQTRSIQQLKGMARTPEQRQPKPPQEWHAPTAEDTAHLQRHDTALAGGSSSRGPMQHYASAEIRERAARSAPGSVAHQRQFGAQGIGPADYVALQREVESQARQGNTGNPANRKT